MHSRLIPSDSFPGDLSAHDDIDIRILHSRVQRQLEYEHAYDDEPHPETVIRHAELVEELTHRNVQPSTWRALLHLIVGEGSSSRQTTPASPHRGRPVAHGTRSSR